MLTQAVHCESLAVVQVRLDAQKLTPVHDKHEPGFPLSQEPDAQDVQSREVGPLQVAHDGSHTANAAAGDSDRTHVTSKTNSLPHMGPDPNRLGRGLSSEFGPPDVTKA